jgi:hypothetical protein
MKKLACAIVLGLLAGTGVHGALANTPSNCSSGSCAGAESRLQRAQQQPQERLAQVLQPWESRQFGEQTRRKLEADEKQRLQAEEKRRRQAEAEEKRRKQAEAEQLKRRQQAEAEELRRQQQADEPRRRREEAERRRDQERQQCIDKCPRFDISGQCYLDCKMNFLPLTLPPR